MNSTTTCTSDRPRNAISLQSFAEKYRLKITRDVCGDQVVLGRHGDICDFGDDLHLCGTFCACGSGKKFSRLRAGRIRQALQENFGQRHQGGIGGDEAVVLFSPTDQRSAQFFIRALGIRRKRRVSPDVAERLRGFRRIAGTALHAVATTPIDCAVVRTGGAK